MNFDDQFFCDIADEESRIKKKKLLVCSDDTPTKKNVARKRERGIKKRNLLLSHSKNTWGEPLRLLRAFALEQTYNQARAGDCFQGGGGVDKISEFNFFAALNPLKVDYQQYRLYSGYHGKLLGPRESILLRIISSGRLSAYAERCVNNSW